MNYFINCYTIHDAKKRFRELAQIHHPDKGGDSKIMAEIIRQYDAFVPSRQPHDNFFKNNSPPRHSASFQGSIPFDHPVMVELRELRSKFNYGMEEENKFLKRKNEDLYEELNKEREAHQKSIDRLKKIINKLQGKEETKEKKPRKERLRKKSTKT